MTKPQSQPAELRALPKTAGGLVVGQADLLKIGSDLMLIVLPSAQFACNAVVG